MRIIRLESRTQTDWSGKFVDDSNYDELVNDSAVIYKPDGTLLAVLLKKHIPIETLSHSWSVLKDYNVKTNNRGVAAGTGYVNWVKQDGTISKTNRTPPEGVVNSGIIGFFERSVRFPYCRACAWNLQHPEKWAKLLPLVQFVSGEFEKFVPEKFSAQKEIVNKTSKDFVIPGTVYTTLTVNKNFRTACHMDAGDLPEGISGMIVIRDGKFEGANLVFPDFRVAVKLDTQDLIFFDPHEFHGNTKIIPLTENATRCSIVFYYRQKIQHCGTGQEEILRVKNRKPGEKLT